MRTTTRPRAGSKETGRRVDRPRRRPPCGAAAPAERVAVIAGPLRVFAARSGGLRKIGAFAAAAAAAGPDTSSWLHAPREIAVTARGARSVSSQPPSDPIRTRALRISVRYSRLAAYSTPSHVSRNLAPGQHVPVQNLFQQLAGQFATEQYTHIKVKTEWLERLLQSQDIALQ